VIVQTMNEWPPKKRCENCKFWRTHWLITFLGMRSLMGACSIIKDRTWRNFACIRWERSADAMLAEREKSAV
jgi:hypothetical protein